MRQKKDGRISIDIYHEDFDWDFGFGEWGAEFQCEVLIDPKTLETEIVDPWMVRIDSDGGDHGSNEGDCYADKYHDEIIKEALEVFHRERSDDSTVLRALFPKKEDI